MNLWTRIRQMSIKQLYRFGVLFLKNPVLISPTLKASKETIRTCDMHFGKLHHSNRKENAFRHALWNYEISLKCLKKLKNKEKCTNWAEKVTNLYEKVTKNDLLEEAMDLHNNAVGRKLFLTDFLSNSTEIERNLLEMTQKSIKFSKIEELFHLQDQLVYISE